MRFGIHCGIGSGFNGAVREAEGLGCECFQIFCKNPRGWKARPLEEGEGESFRLARAESGLWPVVVHVSYLVNLASPKEDMHAKSFEAFTEELRRCDALGADYIVLHPGSPTGGDRAEALRRVGESIGKAWDLVRPSTMVLLENVSGTGSDLGGDFTELAAMAGFSGLMPNVGICLDTCHAYARGWNIADAGGLEQTLDAIDAAMGLEHLRLLHLNDSKGALGGKLDRHEHIGRGNIGLDGFERLVNHPVVSPLPGILETPAKEEGDDAMNLGTLRRLDGTRTAV